MSRSINPAPQYLDGKGKPLANGKLYFFKSGTNTPIITYKDAGQTTPNTHPVLLDSGGRQPNTFFTGTAKQILTDEDDVQIFERDPVGGENFLGEFSLWDSTISYNLNSIVQGSDGEFYISLASGNNDSDPTSTPSKWSVIRFIGVYNEFEKYSLGDVIQTSSGIIFRSAKSDNTGNNPLTDDGTNWLGDEVTTTQLIASNRNPTTDEIQETSGYLSKGVGAGRWQFKGVTGQTPSQSPAQLGDALLNDGNGNQWALILENNTIDVRSLGAKGNYLEGADTGDDDFAIIQAAMDSADFENGIIVTGGNAQYGLSTGVRHKFRRIFLKDMVLCALSGYNAGTIDATDMGSAESGTITAQMITNRGNPLHRCWRRDTPVGTEAAFVGGGTDNVKYLCNDRAPGASFEDCFNFHVKNPTCFKQFKYGIAWLVKNTDSSMTKAKIYEANFGEPKQADPVTNPYNSFGIVQTCADLHLTDCVSNYSLYPLWADGFFNTQWTGLHLYNGNGIAEALPNAWIGKDCGGIQSVSLYNDNGFLHLHSFNHTFIGGRFVKSAGSSNTNYALLEATEVNQRIVGLNITGVSLGKDQAQSSKTIAINETGGNNFSDVKNSVVESLIGLDTDNDQIGYLTNKQIDIPITAGSWVADSGLQRFEFDVMPFILIKTAIARIQTEVQLTSNLVTAPVASNIQVAFEAGGSVTKRLVLWADVAQDITVKLNLSEGFEQVV